MFLIQRRMGEVWFENSIESLEETKNYKHYDEYKVISYRYLNPNDLNKSEIVHEHYVKPSLYAKTNSSII